MVRRASSLPTKISFQIDGEWPHSSTYLPYIISNICFICICTYFLCTLLVQKVVFAASKHLPVGALVTITFERGEHTVSTAAYPVQAFRDGTHGVVVGEALVLACTMYKDSAGKYQVIYSVELLLSTHCLIAIIIIIGKKGQTGFAPDYYRQNRSRDT